MTQGLKQQHGHSHAHACGCGCGHDHGKKKETLLNGKGRALLGALVVAAIIAAGVFLR